MGQELVAADVTQGGHTQKPSALLALGAALTVLRTGQGPLEASVADNGLDAGGDSGGAAAEVAAIEQQRRPCLAHG